MPSTIHETLVGMFRGRPALAAELLADALAISVPAHEAVRLENPDCIDLPATEYRADAVVVLTAKDVPVMAVVVEVQLARDADKGWTWPVYLTTLRARLRCPVELLVVCPDRSVAAWCARAIGLGGSRSRVVPTVLGPDRVPVVTEPGPARRDPEVAVLSALAHGAGEHAVLDVLPDALLSVERDSALLYLQLVQVALPGAAWQYLEALMSTETDRFTDEFLEWLDSRGKAGAILAVLDARKVAVTDEVRSRIAGCREPELLDLWVRRAATAESADELFI